MAMHIIHLAILSILHLKINAEFNKETLQLTENT